MRKSLMVITLCFLSTVVLTPAYASDWDKAGKILTVVEGMRILTGGKVDVVGNITGINNKGDYYRKEPVYSYRDTHRYHIRKKPYRVNVWVPHYAWIEEYVPGYRQYQPGRGMVYIEGHYVQRQVESGGHWEWQECYANDYSYYNGYR